MSIKVMNWLDSESVAKVSFKDPMGWTDHKYPQIVVSNVCTILKKMAIQNPLAFLKLVELVSPIDQHHKIPKEVAEQLLQSGFIYSLSDLSDEYDRKYGLDRLVNLLFLEWFNGNPKYNFDSKEKIQEHE